MTTEDPLKNWQLQQGGETSDQWKLQDAEQNLGRHMQLQEGDPPGPQWQPVEYQREPKAKRRGGWILPSIVIVALLAVLGYVGWVAFGKGGSNPLDPDAIAALMSGAAAPTPTLADAGAAAVVSPTPVPPTATVEPTATPIPEATATATPPPPPVVTMAELISGTVTSPDGVNARSAPDTTAEVVTLLTQNSGVPVVDEENGWLQVILPDNRTAWVSAQFMTQTPQQISQEALAAIYTAAGLTPPTPVEGGAAPEAPTAPAAAAAVTLDATITGDPGVNARTLPDAASVVVTAVTKGTVVTAIGRSADDRWIAVRLADGTPAWILSEFLSAASPFTELPVVDPAALAATTPLTATAAITQPVPALAPTVLQTNGVAPTAPFTNVLPAVGPALTISDTAGVNSRSAPNTTGEILAVVPNGAVLPIVGRTADGSWLQVRLPDDRMGWMSAAAVVVSADAGNAAVIGGEAPSPSETPAETATAAPTAAPAGPTAKATVSNEMGAALRSAPDQNLDAVVRVPVGTVFTAIGRSANSEWVQVALDDGTTAWALVATVTLDSDVGALPVTQ